MKIRFTTTSDLNLEKEILIEGVGFESTFGSSARLRHEGGLPVWETAWSQYTYTRTGTFQYEYTGAERGFLSQDLLPDFQGVLILSAEGSYGKYEGKDALRAYASKKSFAYAKVEGIVPYLRNFSNDIDGYTVAAIAATVYGKRVSNRATTRLAKKAKEKLRV